MVLSIDGSSHRLDRYLGDDTPVGGTAPEITGEEIDSSGRSRTSTIRGDGCIHDLHRVQEEIRTIDRLELQPRPLNYGPFGREIEGKAQRLGSDTGSSAEAHEDPVDAGGAQGPSRVRSQLDERDRYR